MLSTQSFNNNSNPVLVYVTVNGSQRECSQLNAILQEPTRTTRELPFHWGLKGSNAGSCVLAHSATLCSLHCHSTLFPQYQSGFLFQSHTSNRDFRLLLLGSTSMYICRDVYFYRYIYTYVHAYIYIFKLCICLRISRISMYAYVCMYVCMYVCTCTYVCLSVLLAVPLLSPASHKEQHPPATSSMEPVPSPPPLGPERALGPSGWMRAPTEYIKHIRIPIWSMVWYIKSMVCSIVW